MTANAQREISGYSPFKGHQVYYIALDRPQPKGVVLLCGPFPTERLYALAPWMRWARYLNRRGYAAIRFDYRGTGESTGCFADFGFDDWLSDTEHMSKWAQALYPDSPLVLHGMAMEGLLAQQVFAKGTGRALLMWSAPACAEDILRKGLLARISADMLLLKPSERKTPADYFEDLAQGKPLHVDGYPWSRPLWQSARLIKMASEYVSSGEGIEPTQGRPWKHLVLGPEMAPLVRSAAHSRALNPRSALVPRFPLNPDLTPFHASNVEWIQRALDPQKGTLHA